MVRREAVFGSEKDLQAHLTETVQQLADGASDALVRREMPVGGCIPDFLVISFASVPPAEMWPSSWTYRHAFVVAELRRSYALHRSTLASRVYETEERLAHLLDDLLHSRAIAETHSGALRLSAEMRNLRAYVTAVEAKLARWSDALGQAVGYRSFADRVIVAMDAGLFNVSNADVVAHFRREGVGLCVVDRSGPTTVHSGRRAERSSAQREYVCSSVFLQRTQTLWIRR